MIDMSFSNTVILYLIVIFSTTFFSALSQRKRVVNNEMIDEYHVFFFALSFIIHFLVASCNLIGADYENYCWIIKYSNRYLNSSLIEFGFNGLAFILQSVFDNVNTTYCLIKGLAVIVFYYSFYLMRDKISLWMAVYAYNTLVFFYFFLLSMTLASSFILLSMAYILKNDNKKAILFYIIACSIHSSCLLILPAVIMYNIINRNKITIRSTTRLFIIIAYALISIFSTSIYTFLVNNVSAFNQYSVYGLYSSSGLGLLFLIRYFPILYMIYVIFNESKDVILKNSTFVFSLTCILFVLLGYRFTVVSRMYSHFVSIQMFFVPCFLQSHRKQNLITFGKLNTIEILWGVYMIVLGTFDIYTVINYPLNRINSYEFYNFFVGG